MKKTREFKVDDATFEISVSEKTEQYDWYNPSYHEMQPMSRLIYVVEAKHPIVPNGSFIKETRDSRDVLELIVAAENWCRNEMAQPTKKKTLGDKLAELGFK